MGMKEMVAHPLKLATFGGILPEEIEWKPFQAFPPSARLAVVVGEPSEKGLYTVRVRVPQGVKLMPHSHREDRVYTVISGIFYIGLGDRFDAGKLQAYPPGAVVGLRGNASPFPLAPAGGYVAQGFGVGPPWGDYPKAGGSPRPATVGRTPSPWGKS